MAIKATRRCASPSAATKWCTLSALPNKEDAKYFDRAQKVLKQYEGLPVNKALKLKVDAVTGATYSSESLIGNVKAGLDYYKKHK